MQQLWAAEDSEQYFLFWKDFPKFLDHYCLVETQLLYSNRVNGNISDLEVALVS